MSWTQNDNGFIKPGAAQIIPGGFYQGQSQIKGAGMGLFNGKELIKSGSILFLAFARADFSGQYKGNNKFELHFLQLHPNHLVNHSAELYNSANKWGGENMIVKYAIRDIQPFEEIFSNYTEGMNIIKGNGYDVNNWLKF